MASPRAVFPIFRREGTRDSPSCLSFFFRALSLKAQAAERRMVVGASTKGPVIFALAIFDRQVVDAGDPPSHQALFVELPILIAIAAKPVARIVVPFICKAHGYPIVAKRPDLLDQPILQLANPLAYEECLDGLTATNELGAIAPDAIHRIGTRYFGRIARVPAILGEARLLRGRFCGERRKWRPIHFQFHRAFTGCTLNTRNPGPSLSGDIRSIAWWDP